MLKLISIAWLCFLGVAWIAVIIASLLRCSQCGKWHEDKECGK